MLLNIVIAAIGLLCLAVWLVFTVAKKQNKTGLRSVPAVLGVVLIIASLSF